MVKKLATGLLSGVQLGEAGAVNVIDYRIEPAARAALNTLGVAAILIAKVEIDTDYDAYDETTQAPTPQPMTRLAEFEFTFDGLLVRQESFAVDASTTPPTPHSLGEQLWTYDAVGLVKTHQERVDSEGAEKFRQTTF